MKEIEDSQMTQIRIPKKLKARLKQRAGIENRSMQQELIVILNKVL